MWEKYGIGKALNVTDPATKTIAALVASVGHRDATNPSGR